MNYNVSTLELKQKPTIRFTINLFFSFSLFKSITIISDNSRLKLKPPSKTGPVSSIQIGLVQAMYLNPAYSVDIYPLPTARY